MKGKRKKPQVPKILTNQGDKISTMQNIGEEAVNVFEQQFKKNQEVTNYDILKYIPQLITEENNDDMGRMPTREEIKMVAFALSGDSASSPDRFLGQFFQINWDIIGDDVTNIEKVVFCGQEFLRYVTHTNFGAHSKEGGGYLFWGS